MKLCLALIMIGVFVATPLYAFDAFVVPALSNLEQTYAQADSLTETNIDYLH